MTLGRRIRTSREARQLSQSSLGKSLGVTRNAVSAWESGKSDPTSERLRQLAVHLDLDYNWLATGRSGHISIPTGLPLRGAIAAGVWREVEETQDVTVQRVPVAPDSRFPAEAQYALKVEGNSVNRIAKDGALLHCVDIIAAGIEVRHDDLVVVERRRPGLIETTVKRIRQTAEGALQLWPESTDPAHQKPIPFGGKGAEVEVKALVLYVVTPVSRGR